MLLLLMPAAAGVQHFPSNRRGCRMACAVGAGHLAVLGRLAKPRVHVSEQQQ
jgi:hypothetical protein